jgi:ribonuclease Z
MAFLDGMFLPKHSAEADSKMHMTVDEAARVASRAGARRAVLVHISPRYGEEELSALSEAAAQRFEEAEIGGDLKSYFISYREN